MDKNNFRVNEHILNTKITKVEPNKIITRGYNQKELIGKIRYSDMVFLLLKGELPNVDESKLFNKILVSFCDHGVTPPSTQTARLITSSGSRLNEALAGALLSFGKNHAGAIEDAMNLYQIAIDSLTITGDNDLDNKQIASLAIEIFNEYSYKGKKIPGFGHRYHTTDPRASKLLEIAISSGMVSYHTKLALSIQDLMIQRKNLKLNIDGVNAALLSDLGFSPNLGLGVFIIGRIPGIIAHIDEESMDEKEFRRFCNLEDINYEGF